MESTGAFVRLRVFEVTIGKMFKIFPDLGKLLVANRMP
jgi:hypothetical protein